MKKISKSFGLSILKLSFMLLIVFTFQSNSAAKVIRGIVIDVESGSPITDAVIMVVDTNKIVRYMETTDSLGAFGMQAIKENKFNIRTYRYGYVSTTSGLYNLTSHDTLTMIIRLEAIPIQLSDVVVTAPNKLRSLVSEHFYDRRKLGLGYYLTWEDIKERGAYKIQDIFRNVPGIIVDGDMIYFARYINSSLSSDNVPQPDIYIDGMLIPKGSIYNPDPIGWLNPEDVAAVEVYNNINVPFEFKKIFTTGGVILIWTK